MSESASFFDRRIDTGSLPLVGADVVAILAVVAVGMNNHGTLTGEPPAMATALGVTAAPFLVGWALSAVPIGAYSPGAAESAKAAIPLAVRGWIPAVIVGVVVRILVGTSTLGTGVAIFGGVLLVAGAVSLALFRYLYFAVLG